MDVTQANIEWAGVADRIRLFQMESQEAVKRYRDGSLDFVWIDGDHTYPSVLADCQAWWPKIRPGGLFAGHDYDLPDVWKGVRDAGLSVKVMGNAWYLYKPLV
jgi:predicted O-methyltransferase YrrM